jgi:signal peptidase II
MNWISPGIVLLLLDQWSKSLVQRRHAHYSQASERMLPIRYVRSSRQSYGNKRIRVELAATWLIALFSAFILHRIHVTFQTRTSLAGLALAFGGAAGNLLDILRRRYVVDFIDLQWWPVFNLADVGIVGGLLLAFLPN